MKIVTSDQMKELDRRTMEITGIAGEILMERAGKGAAEEILEFISYLDSRHKKRFMIFAGKGNNGGDAYVVARYLAENTNIPVKIIAICSPSQLKGDARLNAERLPSNVCVEVKDKISKEDFSAGDIIIDGLLGTGIKGELKEPYKNFISTINQANLPVIALDIPSGINGNDGMAQSDVLRADMTITMGLPKFGLFLNEGYYKCGRLRCVDIGIPQCHINDICNTEISDKNNLEYEMFFYEDVKKIFPYVSPDSHKNSKGKVVILAGSQAYTGAPLLSALAALKTGAGMVFVAMPASVMKKYNISSAMHPSFLPLIFKPIDDDNKGVFCKITKELDTLLQSADAIVFGPGISAHPEIKPILVHLNHIPTPCVYDADALNLIAETPHLFRREAVSIFTPHPGEARRLLKNIETSDTDNDEYGSISLSEQRIKEVLAIAEYFRVTAVLKGHRTLIKSYDNNTLFINSTGTSGLATAGTGDVLSGIIAALLSMNINAVNAAAAGVFIHGLCAELSDTGMQAFTADAILHSLPNALKKTSPFL